jgi:hypothetical protein
MKQFPIEWIGSLLPATSLRTPQKNVKGNKNIRNKNPVLRRFLTACAILTAGSSLVLVALARSSSAGDFASDLVPLSLQSDLQRGSSEPFRRGCLNADYAPRSPRSVWTMLTDGPPYVTSALKLAVSVRRHAPAAAAAELDGVDLVVMELSTKPLPRGAWERLRRVGWQRCTVDRIAPPPNAPGRTKSRFRDQFTKLHLWDMTGYETVVYLDADTIVVGDLRELLSTRLGPDRKIGAVPDFDNTDLDWTDAFNMGVFLLHPDRGEFERLLALRAAGGSDAVRTDLYLAEQAWLNEVYRGAWQDIGFVHNAQDAIYRGNRTLWNENRDRIRVIHYNCYKPWDWWPYNCGRAYGPLCEIWRKAPTEMGTE